MSVYHARDAAIYVSTSAAGTASPLIKMTQWSLDATTPRIDVTNFDSTNIEELPGYGARRGTFEGFWDNTEDKLFQAAESADGLKIYLYPSRRVPSKYFYGTAWLDFNMEARVDGAARVRGTFSGIGSWGRA